MGYATGKMRCGIDVVGGSKVSLSANRVTVSFEVAGDSLGWCTVSHLIPYGGSHCSWPMLLLRSTNSLTANQKKVLVILRNISVCSH